MIHSESNLGSQLLPPPPPRPTCHMFHSSFSSPPSQGSSSPNPRPRMGLGVAPPPSRPSATSPDANHLASIQTQEFSLSLSLPCVLRRVCGLERRPRTQDAAEMERMVLMEIGDRCGRNWEGERVILIGNGIRKIVLRPQQRRHECYHSGGKGRRG